MPKTQIVINVSGGVVQDVFASEQLADLVVVDWDVVPDDETAVEAEYAGQQLRANVNHPVIRPLRQLAGSEIEAVIDAACERKETDDAVA
jgi:hypothetical protein